ncbi:unnamed protein product, partial [Linum tenue]
LPSHHIPLPLFLLPPDHHLPHPTAIIFLSLETTVSLHPRCEASSNACSEGVHEALNAAVVTEATTINNKLLHITKLHVCKHNYDFNLCAHVLQSYPEASSTTTTNIKSLAKVIQEMAKKQSTILGKLFTELRNNKATKQPIKLLLDLCASL